MTEFVEMIELKGEGHIWVRKDAYVKLEQQIKELEGLLKESLKRLPVQGKSDLEHKNRIKQALKR